MKNLPESAPASGEATTAAQASAHRRPYSRPRLVDYGPIAKLTRGTKSGSGEFTPQGEKRKCL